MHSNTSPCWNSILSEAVKVHNWKNRYSFVVGWLYSSTAIRLQTFHRQLNLSPRLQSTCQAPITKHPPPQPEEPIIPTLQISDQNKTTNTVNTSFVDIDERSITWPMKPHRLSRNVHPVRSHVKPISISGKFHVSDHPRPHSKDYLTPPQD